MAFKFYRWSILIPALILPAMATAQPMSLSEVVREAFAHHPDLAIGRLGISVAEAEQQRISGMTDARIAATAAYSDEKKPTTSPFAANQTASGNLFATISKPLEDGSTVTGTLNYNRTELTYPATVPTLFQSTINPVFSHQIDLSYRYPLLKGNGNPSYNETLLAARSDETTAKWRIEMQKEGIAAQAVALYYQLAAQKLSLKIATDGIARTKRLLEHQKYRERFGLIEKADRLQADALLAARRLDKSNAEAAVIQTRSSLNRLMQRRGDAPLTTEPSTSIARAERLAGQTIETLLEKAETNRPIFKSFESRLAAANARLTVARDQDAAQLDVVGQVGSRALDGSAGTALTNGFQLTDRFIGLSLEFSDSLGGNSSQAGIRQAELAREQVLLEKVQARENMTSELTTTFDRLTSGLQTLKAAEQRVIAESRKFEAEMKRYREGRSNTATIIQFEGDLRVAELQAAMQRTTLQMTAHQLMLVEGTLFRELALSDEADS